MLLRQENELIYYMLQSEEERMLVALNFGDDQAHLELQEQCTGTCRLLLSSTPEAREDGLDPTAIYPYEAAVWFCE
ncbi:hypothetical protein [Paenibacillus donghaensis]|uniref:hypothetical protein n=1 Tax=Paenibacillus donghaensis TaxID=414771 RepID=UPI002AD592D6|nr:hypothetical protein [Paenibacillus donghaensis]